MLTELVKNIKSLPNEMVVIFDKVIQNNFEELEDKNAEQLSEGKNAEGNDLQRYRSPAYARFKKQIGSKSSPVTDLKVTGAFHRDIKIKKVGKGEFEYYNSNEKAPELLQKYKSVLGLNDESRNEFTKDHLREEMAELIKTHLFK